MNVSIGDILNSPPAPVLSYVNRLLYPEGKKGKKNIGEVIMNTCMTPLILQMIGG